MKNKLAYLCSSVSWGGLEMNQFRNALWMKERGHEVIVFCKKKSPIEKACIENSLPYELISDHKKYYDFQAGKKLAEQLRNLKVSHLILRDTRDMSLAVIAKRKLKSNLHLSYFMEMQLGVKKRNLLHSIRFSYFDLWACPLNWLKTQVETMTNFDKKKIRVIPSGLDLSALEINETKEESRTKLDLPSDKVVFGLIGRFDINKGQILVLNALSMLDDERVAVCLLGEPTINEGLEYFDLMKKTIQENNLESKVFIRGFRKDISTFYNAIDCFIMASKAETFGMVTIESMACGTAVIASNAGGSPEILQNGKLGYLFESLNSESLSEKMKLFVEDGIMVSSEELRNEAEKYDHHIVCSMVEDALDL